MPRGEPKIRGKAELAALVLGLLAPACTLLLDRDALSDGHPGPGAGGAVGLGGAGEVAGCVPADDDIYCDGVDRSCQPTTADVGCPAGCVGTTVEGVAYMACSISSTFDQAETRCLGQGMHLVRIDGGDENELAVELARTIGSYVWIGGSNRTDAARFDWTDGTTFYENGGPVPGVYQDFGPDQPAADPGRRCVQLHDATGFWSNAPCSDSLQFICGR